MAELKYFTDKHIPKAVNDQLRNRGVDEPIDGLIGIELRC